MATIPASQLTRRFTQALVAVYRERVRPTSFLRSFFAVEEKTTRYLSIEVLRGGQKIAVDVVRGTEGNRNTFRRSTEKVIDPPYHREYFDITSLEIYEEFFSNPEPDGKTFGAVVKEVSEKLQLLVDKIERAHELQCAQVLQTGIVTVADGSNIDFKRKAGSMVDNSATPWTGAFNPYTQIAAGTNFIKTQGRSSGAEFHMIMGSLVGPALLNNASLIAKGPLSNVNLDRIVAPEQGNTGAFSMGYVTAGDYKVNLWSYPETYDTESATNIPYIDPKNAILIPDKPNFVMGFAAVPQLIDPENPRPKAGAFVFGDFKDQRNAVHEYDVKSAGVAIPVAVDTIYTMKVIA